MESAFRFRIIPIICAMVLLVLLALPACSNKGKTEQEQRILETQTGDATFYARSFQDATTASGRKMDNRGAVAAHRTYPFGTVVRVTNLRNGRSVNVAIVDRGPYGKNRHEGAIIDLSRAAAEDLDFISDGQVEVKVEVLAWGDDTYVR